MAKANEVSVSESITSSASSVASIFGGAEGPLFDELRATRGEIERGWSTFKTMHRRFYKEGRTPANAEDRRDCDALQQNLALQLNNFLGHIKSEWTERPADVPKELLDDVARYIEKRLETVRGRSKMAPEEYNDESNDDDDSKPPPCATKAAPADQSRTSTPIATKPTSTPIATKSTPTMLKRIFTDMKAFRQSPDVVETPQGTRRTRASTSASGK